MWVRVLCGAMLATSLAGNAYQIVQRVGEEPARANAAAQTLRPRAPLEGPHTEPAAKPKPPILPVPTDIAQLDRAALEKRLAAAEAKLEPLLHASEKFERAARSPESEIRLQPYLDELFDVKAGEPATYEVECRDVICKLDSDVTAVDWRMAIQGDLDAIGLFSVRQVGESVYLWVPKDPVNAAGARLVIKIIVSLGMSAKVTACKTAHPTPGEVDFAFRFDRVTRRLSVIASGSLADQPGGQCIRKVLDEILATTPVPPDVTTVLEEPLPIRVP